MAFLTAAAAIYLIACFGLASAAKLRNFEGFASAIAEVTPFMPARSTAAFIVGVEAVVVVGTGAGLATGSSGWLGLGAMLAMCSAITFAIVVFMVLVRGDAVACRCFGANDGAITVASLIGPAMIAATGAVVWAAYVPPDNPAVWIASAAAGFYALIAHLLISRIAGRQSEAVPH
ncbi:MauE/DoxX family redox-associated membrane protein [Pelagerythrobacter sp.]|uniref:MauE/DoxX family redox-associated membrane protein n=1 Tax=Pelagerythrobacter sp. TaxID=2800702 RepID=UPI0035AE3240